MEGEYTGPGVRGTVNLVRHMELMVGWINIISGGGSTSIVYG